MSSPSSTCLHILTAATSKLDRRGSSLSFAPSFPLLSDPLIRAMADRSPTASALLRRFQEHAPHSPQLLGFLTLFISASILIFLIGLTITAAVLSLIFLTPFILLTSPIWVPLAFCLFVAVAGILSLGGFALAAAAGFSWAYRYFKGMHPPGSDRLEYARSRIYDTASHVKDYAREYGGYLQSKVKDAAPGA